jgi:hypothetical protein
VTAEDTRIMLRTGGMNDPTVDHPRQPADYIHPFPDGPVWTWKQRWRLAGVIQDGVGHDDKERALSRHLRVYDLVTPGTDG